MTENYELTRRKALAGLATVGVAGAGAGLGTSALFSDEETFEDNVLTAGTLNLIVDHYWLVEQGMAGTISVTADESTADEEGSPGPLDGGTFTAAFDDIKPGDSGLFAFCPRIDDNPAYLWVQGEITDNLENGVTEPEAEEDGTGGDPGAGNGELADNVQVTLAYCDVDDDVADTDDDDEGNDGFGRDDVEMIEEIGSGSLAEVMAELQGGFPLDGGGGEDERTCFDGIGDEADNPCLCIDWEVPEGVGNVIQSDSLEWDLTFYAEQCRHNDGETNPFDGAGNMPP